MKTKKELNVFAGDLQFEYAKRLAKWEIEVSVYDYEQIYITNKDQIEIIHYMLSTNLRWAFMLHAIIAGMDSTFVTATATRKKLGASRAAVDAMIKECEEAEWITVMRNKNNYRHIQATELSIQMWVRFAQMNSDISNDLRLSVISNVLQEIRTEADIK